MPQFVWEIILNLKERLIYVEWNLASVIWQTKCKCIKISKYLLWEGKENQSCNYSILMQLKLLRNKKLKNRGLLHFVHRQEF
jgi:hypothetical protein